MGVVGVMADDARFGGSMNTATFGIALLVSVGLVLAAYAWPKSTRAPAKRRSRL
jgi:hypothetical protein